MALVTDIDVRGGPARAIGPGTDADRAKLLRRAKRHSAFVRMMRIALPTVAALSLVYYAVALRLALPPTVAGLDPGRISISTDDLVMETPKYEGFSTDGGKYFVTAKTASQDIRQKGPVRLETITGTLTQPDKSLTDLKATRGTFDTKSNVLELTDGIDVVSQNGMRAQLSRATLDTKRSTIVSREPVKVEMPTAQVTSNQLEIAQKARTVSFIDNVVTTLKPEPGNRSAGADRQLAGPQDRRMLSMGRPDLPVVVNSQRLDIDDASKIAVFRGGVKAIQGQAAMSTEELEAHYQGQPAAGQAPAPVEGGGKPEAVSKLSKLVSRVPVELISAGDKATSNAAVFDVDHETATLLGDVVLTSGEDRRATSDRADLSQREDTVLLTGKLVQVIQGKNELKGRRLWVDRKAGRLQLTSPGDGMRGAGRINARFYQAEEKAGAKPKQSQASATPADGALGFGTFKTDPNAPIDIESDSLDVNDGSKQAVFRGKVAAAQGEFKVQTAEMTAFYSGQGALMALPGDTGKPARSAASAPAGAQLTKIEARKGVIVTSKEGQKATGEWADFDVKANTIVLGGADVVLTQGQNVIRGTKLLIDLNTGESRVITHSPAMAVAPAGAPSRKGLPSDSGGAGPFTAGETGRARAVLWPEQAKQAHKKAREEGKSPSEAAAAAATAATGGAWQITEPPKSLLKKSDPTGSSSWDPSSAFPGEAR